MFKCYLDGLVIIAYSVDNYIVDNVIYMYVTSLSIFNIYVKLLVVDELNMK